MDFARARTIMVDRQIRTNDVTRPDLIAAFLAVPRESFVPAALRPLAYLDDDLEVASGRSLMAPATFAKLLQACNLAPGETALVVGAGPGYIPTVMARLCRSVVALESDEGLLEACRASTAGNDRITVVSGPLTEGWAAKAPYDVILLTGAVEDLGDTLTSQLVEGGRLVAAQGTGNAGMARMWVREGGIATSRRLFNCSLPLLPGFARPAGFAF